MSDRPFQPRSNHESTGHAALMLACVASPLAAQSFEGTVTMSVTGDNGSVRS